MAAALGVVVIGVSAAKRLESRTALVPKDSVFRRLAGAELKLDGKACKRDGSFRWLCDELYELKAERVAGLYGSHLCMSTPGKSLELRVDVDVGEFLTGIYETRADTGTLHAWLGEQDLGGIEARPKSLGLQFVQFDTRERAGQRSALRLELNGSILHCFDFRLR